MSTQLTQEELKYKTEQQERLKKFVVGQKDYSGDKITQIFRKSDEFIIYEIESKNPAQSIRLQIDTYLEEDNTLRDRYNEINPNFTKLKGLMYKVQDNKALKFQMSNIISQALLGKTTEANQQIESLIVEINEEYSEQFNHRIRYLITILSVTVILVVSSVYIYYNKILLSNLTLRNFIFISCGGCIGCFLSISRRLRKTTFEKGVSPWLYVLYGFERISISVFGATIIFFAIKSNLAFGMVNEFSSPLYGLTLFSIVAGFSETLIPNLLINLEKTEKEKEK